MKRLILIGLSMLSLSGCLTARFVTAETWAGGDTLYVAYTEMDKKILSETFEAKVLRCKREADNSLKCTEETQVNTLLNKDSATAK
jgi:hypothetical protein